MELETTQWKVIDGPREQTPERVNLKEAIPCVPPTAYSAVFKRTFDVAMSLLLIALLLSWLIPVLFILIRVGSRGPLFFVQQRTGKGGKAFACIKFRTMRLNDESHQLQAEDDDLRVTPIGRILRATHIDELPQLFNVLLNHMSLVGPRPHMLYHDMLFSGMLPQYPLRHLVKPGITGLAQASGYYGSTPDFFSISSRTRLDLFYVKRMSFALDMKIFITTLFIVPAKLVKRRANDN
jgi:putative colanic acid biosysnthesis UDP-glucose lipid carrier transferase